MLFCSVRQARSTSLRERVNCTKHDTPLTDALQRQAFVSLPTAVLVTVTWFRMCLLHMLCQTAENEGVELGREAGVFPSLLPDYAPSGAGELLPSTPCQPGNEHAWTPTGNDGRGWELGNDRGRCYSCQNKWVVTRVKR